MTAPDTSTEVWLDAAVLEELQPPCDATRYTHTGGEVPPAAWVARWQNGCTCRSDINLYCNGCAEYTRNARTAPLLQCPACKGVSRLLSLERL